ncbi:MAG: YibE/F family protein [Geodermatophilaceae bacterium]|nr:YibE/F family protein [Geodermatophilaceae bacterium]
MPHSHTHVDPATVADDPTVQAQQRRALKLMAAVLIPVALATIIGLVLLWPSGTSAAQQAAEQYFPEGTLYPIGEVVAIEPYDCGAPGAGAAGQSQTCARATVTVEDGPEANENVRLDLPPDVYGAGIEPGVRVVMSRAPGNGGADELYAFNDFARGFPIATLALAFAIAVIAVARMRGLASILGLTFAFVILLEFMLPGLLAGSSPVLIGLVGSSAIMLVVLYLAHGFSARTTTALLGTLFGLGMVTALGALGQSAARVTGLASEENVVLAGFAAELDLSGLVLCGIIVAGLGVLNDVTITQASAVWELHQISPELPARNLFASAMRIGRDHIASTVYTIVFAYAGASLPLLLLFEIYQRPVLDIVTSGVIAEEVVRTLVGAIGLILAVPVTTAIGVAIVKASNVTAPVPAAAQRPKRPITQ